MTNRILATLIALFISTAAFAAETYTCPVTSKLPVTITAADSARNAITDITITSGAQSGEIHAIEQPSNAVGTARMIVIVAGVPYNTFFVTFTPGPPATYSEVAGTPVPK